MLSCMPGTALLSEQPSSGSWQHWSACTDCVTHGAHSAVAKILRSAAGVHVPQVECLPTCQDQGAPKKPPIMALDYVLARCEHFAHTTHYLLTLGMLWLSCWCTGPAPMCLLHICTCSGDSSAADVLTCASEVC